MGVEIERKYLVNKAIWNNTDKGAGELYSQGYMLTTPEKTIRVRLTETGGFLTIKGISVGASRAEYEYGIPQTEASELLADFCSGVIEKRRYKLVYAGMVWEVDEFMGANEGLVLAEIELPDADSIFSLPPWIGVEVTGQLPYYNSYISEHPYSTWPDQEKNPTI
ncbi:CYTH domain-containing protein [Cnuella takakiae]|uniref:CYTH domain-containing protein n=1 Tax=Cnuella takakiae TaxID=1302690 RepID=A0A1M4XV77_9BACT|nr:CYTH domain-containing protein [Cnuella takakiae]OLY92956.1 adenylate cyclase [Cnuella takakiae]SHE97389.1 CYTH domain-containing protein [Cnuella takakiae]